MTPIKIYLADLTYTTISIAIETFPLNVGYLAAYCKKRFDKAVDIKIFKYLNELDEALNSSPPDVLGVSNYPWNINAGLSLFKMLQAKSPNTIRIMGGPNIPLAPDEQAEFITRHPLIDFYVLMEGEKAFCDIIERILSIGVNRNKLCRGKVNGTLFRANDNQIVRGMAVERIENLDELPSPYLDGVLDKFFDDKLTPLIESNRGCPFACTYCRDGSSLVNKINFYNIDRVKEELDYIAAHVTPSVLNIMFVDYNFGMYPRDLEVCEYIAKIQKKKNWPKQVEATLGKNKKDLISEAVRILNGTLKLQLSVQSTDKVVLKAIKRSNINQTELVKVTKKSRDLDLATTSELILGLPEDSLERHANSIAELMEAGLDRITTYSAMLLNGSEMATRESREKYGIKSHWRILPRAFGKLSNGETLVEIEEIITSTNTMSFVDYQKCRVIGFIVNVIYNGKPFTPLFKYLKEKELDVFEFIKKISDQIDTAPSSVLDVAKSFSKYTVEELFDSEEELHHFVQQKENYDKIASGEIGINVLQVHIALSLPIMDDWCEFIFKVLESICQEKNFDQRQFEVLKDLKNFCMGRIHSICSVTRADENPSYSMNYDVLRWLKDSENLSIESFAFLEPKKFSFYFTDEQNEIFFKYVSRFGFSPSALGRTLANFLDPTLIWRDKITGHQDTVS